jgi:hypothetical protein
LRAEGITSEPVLLNALSDYDLSDVATFAGLNHVITYAPDLDLYLDSTDSAAPFGVLPFSEYSKPAVFASEVSPGQGRIAILPPGLARATTKTVSHLSKDDVLSGTTTTTASGPYAGQLRGLGLLIQGTGQEAAAKQLLELHGYGSNASGSFEMSSPTEPADSYAITGTFRIDDWSSAVDGTKSFPLRGGMRVLDVFGDRLMGSFFRQPRSEARRRNSLLQRQGQRGYIARSTTRLPVLDCSIRYPCAYREHPLRRALDTRRADAQCASQFYGQH